MIGRNARGSKERRAVIDIGSNSVRLVIYGGPPRAPIAICNEKALCGLGKRSSDNGNLDPGGVTEALATLRRFKRILIEHGSPPVDVIATAAVREAADSSQFVEAVHSIGFEPRVIAGDEEAELAALGVISFEPDATGIAGDMGGGSLELISLSDGELGMRTSLPLGPFNLMRMSGGDLSKAYALASEHLEQVDFLQKKSLNVLYAVGGAWRAISRVNMQARVYPLSILHHYEYAAGEAVEVCDLIAKQSRSSLDTISGISKRRLDTIPYAALVLKALIKRMKAKKIVVSAGGVREGVLFRSLPPRQRQLDPLFEAAQFYASRLAPEPLIGGSVYTMIEPLFPSASINDKRRLRAACLLIDIGAFFHPDHRSRYAFDTALAAPLVGLSHADKVWMALAIFRRYDGRPANTPTDIAIELLSEEEKASANVAGLAMRFAGSYSPKTIKPLVDCRLSLQGNELVFEAPEGHRELMGASPRKRLDAVAALLNAVVVENYN